MRKSKWIYDAAREIQVPDMSFSEYIDLANRGFDDLESTEYYTRELTNKEYREERDQLVRVLLRLGLKKGDVVTALMPPTLQGNLLLQAVNMIGAIYAPINPQAHPNFLKEHLNLPNHKTKIIYAYDGLIDGIDVLETIKSILDSTEVQYILVDGVSNYIPKDYISKVKREALRTAIREKKLRDLLQTSGEQKKRQDSIFNLGKQDSRFLNIERIKRQFENDNTHVAFQGKAEDLAIITYTSGSTGKPKVVGATNRNITAISFNHQIALIPEIQRTGKFLYTMPNFVITALACAEVMPKVFGVQTSINADYNPKNIVSAVERTQPNYLIMAPIYFEVLADHYTRKLESRTFDERDYQTIKNIHLAISGSAPFKKRVYDSMVDLFAYVGNKKVLGDGYGATQLSGTSFGSVIGIKHNNIDRPGVFVPFPQVRYDVVDPITRESVKDGEIGMLVYDTTTPTYAEYIDPEPGVIEGEYYSKNGVEYWISGDLVIPRDGTIELIGREERVFDVKGLNIKADKIVNQLFDVLGDYAKDLEVTPGFYDGEQHVVAHIVLRDEFAGQEEDVYCLLMAMLNDNLSLTPEEHPTIIKFRDEFELMNGQKHDLVKLEEEPVFTEGTKTYVVAEHKIDRFIDIDTLSR